MGVVRDSPAHLTIGGNVYTVWTMLNWTVIAIVPIIRHLTVLAGVFGVAAGFGLTNYSDRRIYSLTLEAKKTSEPRKERKRENRSSYAIYAYIYICLKYEMTGRRHRGIYLHTNLDPE